MSPLPSPKSKLRELLHDRHSEAHQVIAESRREISQRLRFIRQLLIDLEKVTKHQAKERRCGLRFSNTSDSLLDENLEAVRIHSQALFREIARVNKAVKESMDLPDDDTKQSEAY